MKGMVHYLLGMNYFGSATHDPDSVCYWSFIDDTDSPGTFQESANLATEQCKQASIASIRLRNQLTMRRIWGLFTTVRSRYLPSTAKEWRMLHPKGFDLITSAYWLDHGISPPVSIHWVRYLSIGFETDRLWSPNAIRGNRSIGGS